MTITLMSQGKACKIVRERSEFCELGCGRRGTDAAHRLPRKHLGPWYPPNLLRICHECHMASENRRELSYSMGWLIRSGIDPEPWDTIPALIEIPNWTGPAWWIPTPDGMYAPVAVEDLPMVCDPTLSLPEALFRLHATDRELRELIPEQREGA